MKYDSTARMIDTRQKTSSHYAHNCTAQHYTVKQSQKFRLPTRSLVTKLAPTKHYTNLTFFLAQQTYKTIACGRTHSQFPIKWLAWRAVGKPVCYVRSTYVGREQRTAPDPGLGGLLTVGG